MLSQRDVTLYFIIPDHDIATVQERGEPRYPRILPIKWWENDWRQMCNDFPIQIGFQLQNHHASTPLEATAACWGSPIPCTSVVSKDFQKVTYRYIQQTLMGLISINCFTIHMDTYMVLQTYSWEQLLTSGQTETMYDYVGGLRSHQRNGFNLYHGRRGNTQILETAHQPLRSYFMVLHVVYLCISINIYVKYLHRYIG